MSKHNDGHGYPILNVENITRQVAEMFPVTDAQRQRSLELDRSKLREELDKLNHSVEWHRAALDKCAVMRQDLNEKIAAKQRFLDNTSAQATGQLRRQRATAEDDIRHLAQEYSWWTSENTKFERLLKAGEERLEVFPFADLKKYEAEQKVLREAGV